MFHVLLKKSLVITTAVLLYISLNVSALRAQSAPVTQSEFWERVQHTLAVVQSLDSNNTVAMRAALDTEAQAYSVMTSIMLPDGTVIPQDNSYLLVLLQQEPPDLEQIESYLGLLLETQEVTHQPETESSALPQAEGPSPAEILARPEFKWEEQKPNPFREWLDKMYARFLDFLSDLFPGVPTAGGLRPIISIVGALLLVLILAYALRGLVFDVVSTAEMHDDDDEEGIPLTAAGALQRAQDNAATGDYRTAVRYLYLSTLLQLEEHDLLRYDRARTNREYLRSVAHLPQLATLLRDVVDVFDRVWYGYQTIDEASFQKYVARVTELRHFR